MTNRKLQTEIDRVLKKVQEGLEVFDELYDKVYSAPSPQQKEKYEADLKKEIKKLQRYRDQIKQWAGSSDVKDKAPLLQARKDIETDMERFKVCEKETKTKAYSKEGLKQAEKKDPEQIAREKTLDWMQEASTQIESFKEAADAEMESLQGGKKKKTNARDKERIEMLSEKIEVHSWHVEHLEKLMRLLENEGVDYKELDEIKDSVDYYIENYDDPDFYHDDSIYDDIQALEAVDENPGLYTPAAHKDPEPEPAAKPAPAPPPAPAVAAPAAAPAIPLPQPLPQSNSTKEQAAQAARSREVAAAAERQRQQQLQQQQQQQAKAAAEAQRQQLEAQRQQQQQQKQAADARAAEAARQQQQQQARQQQQQASARGIVGPSDATVSRGEAALPKPASQLRSVESPAAAWPAVPADSESHSRQQAMETVDDTQVDDTAFDTADAASMLEMLELSHQNIPAPSDSDRPKSYVAHNPYPTHSSFPQMPLQLFESSAMFEKLDIDTLFFIFYYQQGTYQQYLAARELKRQSWRFHKKYMTWFQRHEEPKVTTDEYEQGTYVYFDFETGWCQRIKSEFTFEYSYLEDELQV